MNEITVNTQRDVQQPEAEKEIGMIEEGWILMLGDHEQVRGYIWLDSACFDHVCPPWFGDTPIEPCDADHIIRSANGHQLKLYGTRTLELMLNNQKRVSVKFFVLDILRPLLSIPRLVMQGYDVKFGKIGGEIRDQ